MELLLSFHTPRCSSGNARSTCVVFTRNLSNTVYRTQDRIIQLMAGPCTLGSRSNANHCKFAVWVSAVCCLSIPPYHHDGDTVGLVGWCPRRRTSTLCVYLSWFLWRTLHAAASMAVQHSLRLLQPAAACGVLVSDGSQHVDHAGVVLLAQIVHNYNRPLRGRLPTAYRASWWVLFVCSWHPRCDLQVRVSRAPANRLH